MILFHNQFYFFIAFKPHYLYMHFLNELLNKYSSHLRLKINNSSMIIKKEIFIFYILNINNNQNKL